MSDAVRVEGVRAYGKRSTRQPRCQGSETCRHYPGENTPHAGWGFCRSHTNRHTERIWAMAFDVARELEISPWEALLRSVKLAAGRVAWVDEQLRAATQPTVGGADDGQEVDQQAVARWLAESRKERTLLARSAKAAIDGGVAERLVRQVELEGELVAEVLGRTLDALELSDEQRILAFNTAHRVLLEPSRTALDEPRGGEGPTGP